MQRFLRSCYLSRRCEHWNVLSQWIGGYGQLAVLFTSNLNGRFVYKIDGHRYYSERLSTPEADAGLGKPG